MEALFGPELVTKSGVKKTSEVLNGKKAVGIYFSAHWCPPCRGFTPVLAEFYSDVVAANENDLEIVFVSSDSDQHAFDEYYGEMPWVSVPFGAEAQNTLGTKYGVRGIPTFIVIDGADGSTKDKDGRQTVTGAKGNINAALAKWK